MSGADSWLRYMRAHYTPASALLAVLLAPFSALKAVVVRRDADETEAMP